MTNSEHSLRTAWGIGIGVGIGALVVYFIAGLTFADWSLTEFFARLTLGTGLGVVLAGVLVVACVALPIAAYLYDRLRSPLVILLLVLAGWVSYGLASGILTVQTAFGLAIYAMYFSPLYLVLYAVVGGIEYFFVR